MRFKNPPTADSEIGWRVEFRPMDLQLTDFENTAVTIMVGMIANIINTFDVDFIVPITMVDENMKRAHSRDAVSQVKFWWKVPRDDQVGKPTRENDNEQTQFLRSNSNLTSSPNDLKENNETDQYKEFFIWQILDGDVEVGMPTGIISLSQQFMKLKEWPEAKKKETMKYLNFLSMRARGKLPTGAQFIRDFVMSHPDYKQDSYLSPEI